MQLGQDHVHWWALVLVVLKPLYSAATELVILASINSNTS